MLHASQQSDLRKRAINRWSRLGFSQHESQELHVLHVLILQDGAGAQTGLGAQHELHVSQQSFLRKRAINRWSRPGFSQHESHTLQVLQVAQPGAET
jgi:hypothetical protein